MKSKWTERGESEEPCLVSKERGGKAAYITETVYTPSWVSLMRRRKDPLRPLAVRRSTALSREMRP